MATSTRAQIAWLHRRVGFGLAPGELDALESLGTDRVLDRLLDPDDGAVPASPDPWEAVDLTPPEVPGQVDPSQVVNIISAWFGSMTSTPRPLQEWMRWFWHGHFVSTMPVVKSPALLVQQVRMLGALGLTDMGTLLRSVSTDAAMLIYLDGRSNAAGAVNENYGRELLELFSLGIGNYTESDVRAASVALTGWVVRRESTSASFVQRRHDPTPQAFLGAEGVSDLDAVVAAIVAEPACARYVTGALGEAILGPGVDPGLLDRLARDLHDDGLELRPLVRALLEAGLDGAATTVVRSPVVWFASACRILAVPPSDTTGDARAGLANMGQIPLNAPNVAGWPGGRAWLSASADLGRWNLAVALAASAASRTSAPPATQAARSGDLVALADALGRPDGFSATTSAALEAAHRAAQRPEIDLVALALVAPDTVVDEEVPI